MRISDWSSDVCSSDLGRLPHRRRTVRPEAEVLAQFGAVARGDQAALGSRAQALARRDVRHRPHRAREQAGRPADAGRAQRRPAPGRDRGRAGTRLRRSPRAQRGRRRRKQALADATAFVKAKDLVTVPDDPVKIILMPEFQRGVAVAYCDSPGPLDKGLDTYFAISPIPDDWSDEQATSFLREYNSRMIDLLAIQIGRAHV